MAISCLMCAMASHVIIYGASRGGRSVGPHEGDHAALIERFLTTDATLTSYRAFRTLEATTRRGKMHARLTAWTSVDPVQGFQYSIVDEDGSGVLRRRVLRAALEAERSLRETGDLARGALSEANYTFTTGDTADGLVRIGLQPKRRDTMLVEGSMLLTQEAGDLVRVEGWLVKRPSAWTRRVEVVRRYARIAGVRAPVSMHSTAQVLMVGASTFSMTYEYESVNGEPVKGLEHRTPEADTSMRAAGP